MKNYIQRGEKLDYSNTGAAIAGGSVIVLSGGIGVAAQDIPDGSVTPQLGTLVVEGVVELAKETGQAWAVGELLYWDSGNSRLTKTATGNKLAGYVAKDAASADALGNLKMVYLGDDDVTQFVQGVAVADLNQTIAGPSIAEVQAISDKVDELLASLRAGKIIAT